MPHFDNQDKDPILALSGSKAGALVAARAGIAAGASPQEQSAIASKAWSLIGPRA